MLFNSYIFILAFLPICLIGWYTLNHFKLYSIAQVFLLGMSLWFYGYFNVSYLLIIIVSVCLNYIVYLLLDKYHKKSLMVLGVLANLGILMYFKYMDFFISNINMAFHKDIALLNIALPLGISFFTFQQVSFVVDAYKGEVPKYNFLHYACFVTYFPQLIAGPIVTHDELVPQFLDEKKKHIDWENMSKGMYIFALGLGKKVLIADVFGVGVDWGYSNLADLDSITAFLVMLGYTIQIYFDFSGYCDMAIGLGKMMNIDLPLNFNSPYKALTINEFWARWHMTLTRFFTRYVYIPLGGNRKGAARTYLNIFIVFLASGFWHGANWTFIVWGIMHGVFQIITRMFKKGFNKIPKVINWTITFLFVNIAWVFFRADSLTDAVFLIKRIFAFENTGFVSGLYYQFMTTEMNAILPHTGIQTFVPGFALLFFYIGAMLIILLSKNAYEKMQSFEPKTRYAVSTALIMVWCIFSFSGVSTFLYFNF